MNLMWIIVMLFFLNKNVWMLFQIDGLVKHNSRSSWMFTNLFEKKNNFHLSANNNLNSFSNSKLYRNTFSVLA